MVTRWRPFHCRTHGNWPRRPLAARGETRGDQQSCIVWPWASTPPSIKPAPGSSHQRFDDEVRWYELWKDGNVYKVLLYKCCKKTMLPLCMHIGQRRSGRIERVRCDQIGITWTTEADYGERKTPPRFNSQKIILCPTCLPWCWLIHALFSSPSPQMKDRRKNMGGGRRRHWLKLQCSINKQDYIRICGRYGN